MFCSVWISNDCTIPHYIVLNWNCWAFIHLCCCWGNPSTTSRLLPLLLHIYQKKSLYYLVRKVIHQWNRLTFPRCVNWICTVRNGYSFNLLFTDLHLSIFLPIVINIVHSGRLLPQMHFHFRDYLSYLTFRTTIWFYNYKQSLQLWKDSSIVIVS